MARRSGGSATAEWREPASFNRLPSIGVSLQPAIPRRVAPQQSPLPLHRSPSTIAQSRSAEATKSLFNRTAGMQSTSRYSCPRQRGCHLYFARPVTFLSCADSFCKRNIEMTPLCKIEVTLPRVLGSRELRRGGVVDEQAGVQPS